MRRLCPRRLGSFVQANAQRLLLLLGLALLLLCAAINSVKLDTELASWIHKTSRVDHELSAIDSLIGDGAGSNSLLILQATNKFRQPKNSHSHKQHPINHHPRDAEVDNVLTVESLMTHLEALAIATHVTVDLFDVSWSLKDICFSPTLPDYEGMLVNQLLDNLMPCAIKTPLDCFWEGSKLLGPEQDVRLSSIGPKLKWTSLNPLLLLETKKLAQPHASFPHDALISWMKRVGITTGYQYRPCLDPTDPNCPITAPNRMDATKLDIGALLTGGCRGLATNQMHWKEEEIVGGVHRNSSGFIVKAEALQSTIQLLGERDVYDYWRKTTKVQDINNWSTDKAKMVLDLWLKRFQDELSQFTRTSMNARSYKIHALTPNAMLEPIASNTVLDTKNFKITVVLLTVYTCLFFPSFVARDSSNQTNDSNTPENQDNLKIDTVLVSRPKLILIACCVSLFVVLTFTASLGLSSFMNLPFNMATTQILPPLALYYGFRQALLISSIYSRHFTNTPPKELTTECLNELIPVVIIESLTMLVPLTVASLIPVHATRVFILQSITYVILSALTAIILIPALLVAFLVHNSYESSDKSIIYIAYTNKPARCISPGLLSIKSKKGAKNAEVPPTMSIEEQIFSRLQEDLRKIRADNQQATDINFSIRADGSKTSFKLTTSRFNSHDAQRTNIEQYVDSQDNSNMPDLLMSHLSKKASNDDDCIKKTDRREPYCKLDKSETSKSEKMSTLITRHHETLTTNSYIKFLVYIIRLAIFAVIMTHASRVRYGLQLRDIIAKNTNDYDSFMVREKYFPVYNVFAITRGDFDYPSNQGLLHEYHSRIEQVDGIVKDSVFSKQPKFWLVYFRDWLLELQEQFDIDRNKSAISVDGWGPEVGEASKLAYKLIVQTGKIDNPIDKSLFDTNRLVDRNGIINQRAFYYYLTAWVMNDAYTYSISEANFKPEPKTWNENPNDLRIERARPLQYAQIPFLMSLPEDVNGLETIVEVRAISQAFEQLGLQNFPTGIPFIFWDQFINLDFLFIVILSVIFMLVFAITSLLTSSLNVGTIISIPAIITIMELYSTLGYLSFQFNTIVATLLINSVGIMTTQTVHCTTIYQRAYGSVRKRLATTLNHTRGMTVRSSTMLLIVAFVFINSGVDFMTKYFGLIIYLSIINFLNSLVLTPMLLVDLGPRQQETAPDAASRVPSCNDYGDVKPRKPVQNQISAQSTKKNKQFPRFHSEISLSTISEEPQTNLNTPDTNNQLCAQNLAENYMR